MLDLQGMLSTVPVPNTRLPVVGWPQTLNEDYFAIFDLQQASLPGVRTLLVLQRATVLLGHDRLRCTSTSMAYLCFSLQIVNLTQALVSEFNTTLAYNPYPTPGKCLPPSCAS